MNKSIVRTLSTLSLAALLGPLGLYAQSPIHVNVPFEFAVGQSAFPAGEYRVSEINPTVLAIQRTDGKKTVMTSTLPNEPNRNPGYASLTFNKYGDRYFLAGIAGTDRVWKLHKTAAERELIAKAAAPSPVSVVASLGK